MNIGFIYGQKTYPPGTGGSIHGYQLSKCLTEKGCNLSTLYWGDPDNPWFTHYRLRDLLKFISAIDILYLRVEWSSGPQVYSLLKLLRPYNLPVIWELNGTSDEIRYVGRDSDYIRSVEKRLRRLGVFADAAVCVTEEIADYAKANLKLKRTQCIPNGSDPGLFFPVQRGLSDDERPLRVAWVGSTNAKWHDISTFIQAAQELKNEHIEFWIFGDPSHLPKNLPSNLITKGMVDYNDLGIQLSQADVGIHLFIMNDLETDFIKGSPLKLFDYMSCGIAAVAQSFGQLKVIFEQYGCGLETSGRLKNFCYVLIKLEQDRSLCRQLGLNGRKAVEEYYNWNRVAEETMELCNELIAAKK